MWPNEPKHKEIDVEKIKQVIEQHGWYWNDGGDATTNVINVINCVVATMHMHDAANRSMTARYNEMAIAACNVRSKIMDEVWGRAKRVRDEWHKKWQRADSKMNHYKKAIDACPVPGAGWGIPEVAIKQCDEYHKWYHVWVKPILKKEPMQ